MNADVLTARVTDGIAVIILGSARRIYFDEEMGDALTEALDGFAGNANVRVVVITGGAPGSKPGNERCPDRQHAADADAGGFPKMIRSRRRW